MYHLAEGSVSVRAVRDMGSWLKPKAYPGYLLVSSPAELRHTQQTQNPICKCYSVTQSCPILCDSMDCSTPGFPVLHSLPEFAQTHVHWVDDTIQPSHPLLPSSPVPSIFPSIRLFSNESALCIRWPKYWSISFGISPSNEYSGLISSRSDWFDLLAVQGTLKSLLQHQSLKASFLRCSAFFMVQFSHPFMTIGKTIVLTICTFVRRRRKWQPSPVFLPGKSHGQKPGGLQSMGSQRVRHLCQKNDVPAF